LIKIFDISDLKSPILLTKTDAPGEVLGLVAADNYLFINFKGVLIKDISDLNAIVDVGNYRRTKRGSRHRLSGWVCLLCEIWINDF